MTAPTQAQIEAAAKAIFEFDWSPSHRWELALTYEQEKYRKKAEAALTAAAEVGKKIDLEANRLYRYLNGLDQDSHDSRAEHIMQQSLDGLTISPNNRNSTKEILANHFEAVEATTIERCAQVARKIATVPYYNSETAEKIASDIEALKDQP